MKRSILQGAVYGLLVWLVYGVAELVLACGPQLFSNYEVELASWQWRLIGMLFGVYALAGLGFGALGGALLGASGRARSEHQYRVVALVSLVVAFVANLISHPLDSAATRLAFTAAILFAIGLCWSLAYSASSKRLSFLANPWMACLFLLVGPWAVHAMPASRSVFLRLAAAFLFLGMILILGLMWHRCLPERRMSIRQQAVTAAVVMGIFILRAIVPPTEVASTTGSREGGARDPFNILLITMDTVRADYLSVYGYERDTTPNLRALAQSSTLYTRAMAVSDYTFPTHASIFTGLYPDWHGTWPEGHPLAPQFITLAETLRAHGYWTGAAVANLANLQPSLGFGRGFSSYKSARPMALSSSDRRFYLREGAQRLLRYAMDTRGFAARTLRAEDINRQGLDLLKQVPPGKPFFLFLNYMDAHTPYAPLPPFSSRFPGRDRNFDTLGEEMASLNPPGKTHIDSAGRRHLISQYEGGIAYEDAQIGKLLTRLRELGLYDETLIIVTADHGEAFGEHGRWTHARNSVHPEHIHIPLVIKYPRQHDSDRSDGLVSQVDLVPTVVDLAGIAPPPGLQGQTLRKPRTDSDALYASASVSASVSGMDRRLRGVRRGLMLGSLKLITWTEGPPELYDLATDPGEEHNLYRPDDPRSKALEDRLAAWTSTIPKIIGQPRKLDNSSVERLKSLGYVQ